MLDLFVSTSAVPSWGVAMGVGGGALKMAMNRQKELEPSEHRLLLLCSVFVK